jgi:predicted phage terminase large subunit-like protein
MTQQSPLTEEISRLVAGMSRQEMAEIAALTLELDERRRMQAARDDFLAFIALVDPKYKFGTHLRKLGQLLMDVEVGIKDRVAVSMGPRFGKSQMISIYYPAWYLGRNPDHKLIMASHTADLAVDMARKVRNLMQTPLYQKIFPGVSISADAKAAGKWTTSKGGEAYAVGVGGALAGRGADLCVIDDPISEQALKTGDYSSLETVYQWFTTGVRTRLMPGARVAILHTRWHTGDLIGKLLQDGAQNTGGDKYEYFAFPAILNADNPPDHPTDPPKSLWPGQWTLEALLRTKASMPLWQWNAQYMQDPTAQESAIIKRDWIKWWEKPEPPAVDFIVQGWDTALTTKTRSDWSACLTFGVWTNEDNVTNVILLNSVKGKWEFPDLKVKAHDQYRVWQPDSVIIEAKASGQPLIDEMRRSGIFVQDFSPGKGQDKIARLNAVSDMFSAGHIWFPRTRWAEEVVEELLSFPTGVHDDLCFTAGTMILMGDGSSQPIESVQAGQWVATPFGVKQVVASGCTGVREVVAAAGLVGTHNHPIATEHGWTLLGGITRESRILTVANYEGSSWLPLQNPGYALKPLRSMGIGTGGTPTAPGQHIDGIPQRVYNISVEGVECYFANGVLVHNCDALTLCLARVRKGGFLRLSTDPVEDYTPQLPRRGPYAV